MALPQTEYHDRWLSVVGVADDARYRELTATRLDLYMSYRQSDHRPHHVVVRGSDSAPTAAAVMRIVREMNPGQPPPETRTMTDVVAAATAVPRFAARILSAFAVAALLLACLGLYGLVAGSVGRRTREIGMRVILGARPSAIVRLVLREGLRPTVAGLVLGLSGGLAAGRFAASLLYGVTPTDPIALVAACGLLLVVALGAMAVPARRALRLQPAEALRQE